VLSSAAGQVEVPVEVTDEMMPGVVSLPHGWGHGRPGVRLGVASQHAGASINDVTDERFVDQLTGTAALSGQRVTVRAVPPAGPPAAPRSARRFPDPDQASGQPVQVSRFTEVAQIDRRGGCRIGGPQPHRPP
jgi:hypothetical protein